MIWGARPALPPLPGSPISQVRFVVVLAHLKVCKQRAGITALDRTLVVSLIERIMVYRDKRVEIVYRWQNEFRWQVELLQRAQQSFSQREAV